MTADRIGRSQWWSSHWGTVHTIVLVTYVRDVRHAGITMITSCRLWTMLICIAMENKFLMTNLFGPFNWHDQVRLQ